MAAAFAAPSFLDLSRSRSVLAVQTLRSQHMHIAYMFTAQPHGLTQAPVFCTGNVVLTGGRRAGDANLEGRAAQPAATASLRSRPAAKLRLPSVVETGVRQGVSGNKPPSALCGRLSSLDRDLFRWRGRVVRQRRREYARVEAWLDRPGICRQRMRLVRLQAAERLGQSDRQLDGRAAEGLPQHRRALVRDQDRR